MKKLLIVLALAAIALVPASVWAAQGGEPSNTGCNGQGNPNSPCIGGNGGNGGQGGQGGNGQGGQGGNSDAHSHSKAKAAATATSGAAASAGAGATSAGQSVRIDTPHQAPAVSAPSLAVGSDVCRGSTSFGVSGPMAGISFGNTFTDDDCQLRAFARSLQALGHPEAALALLATNPAVATALRKAGFKAAWLEDGKDLVVAARAASPVTLVHPVTTNFALDRP